MVQITDWEIQLCHFITSGCAVTPRSSLSPCGWGHWLSPTSITPFLSLSQDAAHLESGQPVQCESDVIMYIQECEGLIRQLQVDLQILRDENYYQLEELAFR